MKGPDELVWYTDAGVMSEKFSGTPKFCADCGVELEHDSVVSSKYLHTFDPRTGKKNQDMYVCHRAYCPNDKGRHPSYVATEDYDD